MEKQSTSTTKEISPGCDKTTTQAKPITPAARRALDEAAERRQKFEQPKRPIEIGGRGGLEPVRYNDWELKGLVSDF